MTDLLEPAYAAARWGWYLAACLILGASSYAPFFLRGIARRAAAGPILASELSRRAARVGFWGAFALVGFGLVRLWLQAHTLLDPEEPISIDLVGSLLASTWGRGWTLQGAMALGAAVGFASAMNRARVGWIIANIASMGVAVTAGMTGHAATARSGPGGWLLDAAHVGAGGVWLGGLAVVVLAGIAACRSLDPAQRSDALRQLIADFSRRALVAAPVMVAFGLWLAARYLGWTWPLRFSGSGYGWALAGKVTVVVLVGAVGAYNWKVLQPRLEEPGGDSRIGRSGALELLLGVIVLGITAILVGLPFPER